MSTQELIPKPLCQAQPGEKIQCFVLVTEKEHKTTRSNQPYFRLTFKDAGRSVTSMIWSNSPLFEQVQDKVHPGEFYKVRGVYSEGEYGPQLDLQRLRLTEDSDARDGFNPADFFEHSRFDSDDMWRDLNNIVERRIEDEALQTLVIRLLADNEDLLRKVPAATHHHHPYTGGWLEHTLSVTRTAVYLADKYTEYYSDLQPPLDKDLIIAGAVLHDVGKVKELDYQPWQSEYSVQGHLIGHISMGRDMVREMAGTVPELDQNTLLLLEHIILGHQGQLEWSSPVLPRTLECLIVHYADDLDAKVQIMINLRTADTGPGPFTDRRNVLGRAVFKGFPEEHGS